MIRNKTHNFRLAHRRRGSIYIAVFAMSLIIITLAVGGIVAARAQARQTDADGDVSQARAAANSGLELARLWMSLDPNWRTNRVSGSWTSGLSLGSAGSVSISVVDPLDGDLTNRQYDPVTVTATGSFGRAQQTLQQTLVASPVAINALAYPLLTGGQVHARLGKALMLGAATVSTNGAFQGDGGSIVEGNVEAGSASSAGIVFGTLTTGAASKTMPASGMDETYARLGTLIAAPTIINKQVLGPGVNPWGAANADGAYVIRTSSDITISNSRIYGTLIIIAPGKNVTISGNVLLQPARSDYPALIVNGNLNLQFTTASGLSEAAQGVNFNPAGAPYLGASDADMIDVYPSEIQGLVHVIGGTVQMLQPGRIRGALICESTASSNAVDLNASSFQIVYDQSLYTNPPQFYTSSVSMIRLAGSLRQNVN
jgi:hypothetical protein